MTQFLLKYLEEFLTVLINPDQVLNPINPSGACFGYHSTIVWVGQIPASTTLTKRLSIWCTERGVLLRPKLSADYLLMLLCVTTSLLPCLDHSLFRRNLCIFSVCG